MLSLNLSMPPELAERLAARFRERRLELNFSQASVAKRAKIPLPTLRRFERTGQIQFLSLLWLAGALHRLDDFSALFAPPPIDPNIPLEKLLKLAPKKRKRGKK